MGGDDGVLCAFCLSQLVDIETRRGMCVKLIIHMCTCHLSVGLCSGWLRWHTW